MVIINPILERDESKDDVIWNAAVVISQTGKIIGKTRKNHIPRVGDFNESTYYMESFFRRFTGKIAINICYGRHHPQNWMMYGLNGAEIIFNPSATVGALSEPLWRIEARQCQLSRSLFHKLANNRGALKFRRKAMVYHVLEIGVLVVELDLNLCRQTKDSWGFRMTNRLDLYADSFTKAAQPYYKPDIRKET
ncbi:hydrolase, carbon-nitrogen family [Cooperia oncophora]